MAVAIAVLGLVASVAVTVLRLRHVGTELAAARAGALHGTPVEVAVADGREPLPLPSAARRFEITQRILEELQDKSFAPEQIRFKFEHVAEAGVTRQVAVFTVRTRWDEVARLLGRLQAADRSAYIARLRVARESVGDAMVDADIQLAVALLDDNAAVQVAP
ncbi:hypothetical protein [Rhodanobacter thiooxydans]|nr:hypothetical protein [Rhodanobacter thiooxydans]EIL98060.1 hypothetical protein UUA_12820 [Rhodanobacter thiooxydans LCS2]MCW0203588.1 hypothetical protein [Rhodanobacter thiooxydans]